MRRFVIGDIHGCAKALRTLIETIAPRAEDELVFLGDYVDRGPDSRDVVDQVIDLHDQCRVVALRGNHEIMLMGVALGGLDDTVWLANGGKATVTSYNGCLSKIPAQHLNFFQDLVPYYEMSDTICVHAGYHHELAMHEQDDATTYWNHLTHPLPRPHYSGKRVFIGHTPQADGNVLDRGHVVCIDTYCFGGGFLTAYEIESGEVIQANYHGHLRRPPLFQVAKAKSRIAEFCRAPFGLSRNGKPTEKNGTQTEIDLANKSAES